MFTLAGIQDDRDEDGTLTAMMTSDERLYEIVFIEDGAFLPVEVKPQTTEGVHVDDLWWGLLYSACEEVHEELGVEVRYDGRDGPDFWESH
jgi:hypothetical protein